MPASLKPHFVALALYSVLFLGLFAQFPLQKSIPGNCDSWLVIAMSNTLDKKIDHLFGGPDPGKAMYPVDQVHFYGESAILIELFYVAIKKLSLNDYQAYYIYISLIFILNAYGVFLLSSFFIKRFAGALFAGFAFACSNMAFAHIDDSICFFYFIPCFVFYLLMLWYRGGSKRLIYAAFILAGIEAWVSVYVFFYQSVVMTIIILYHDWRGIRSRFTTYLSGTLLYLLAAAPILGSYIFVLYKINYVTPFEAKYTIKMTSLNLADFFLALPGNLLYSGFIKVPLNWGFLRHHNFLGILIVILAIIGMSKWNKGRRGLFAAIMIAGFLLAVGPYFMARLNELAPTPLYPFYEWIPILSYLRVTGRAYFLVSMSLSVFAGMAVERLWEKVSARSVSLAVIASSAIFGVHAIENIPFPMKAYPIDQYIEMPKEYTQIISEGKTRLILDLPSKFYTKFTNWDYNLFSEPSRFVYRSEGLPELKVDEISMFNASYDDLFQYNREIIYLYWQTKHRQNTINGVNGYFPTPRMIFQRRIHDIPQESAMKWLKDQGVEFIVYHKDMLIKKEDSQLGILESSPFLIKKSESERIVIFSFADF